MHPQDRLFCEIAVQLELLTRDQVGECLQTMQNDARGRHIGAIATSLSFLTQAEAELVLVHQQRVLDRRREARAASKGQRDAEARVAASRIAVASRVQAPENPALAENDPRRVRRKDPTPTAPWVHDNAEPGLAESEARVPSASSARAEDRQGSRDARETLDERSGPHEEAYESRAAREATPPARLTRDETSFESLNPGKRSDKPAPPPHPVTRRPMSTQLEARPGSSHKSGPPKPYGPTGTHIGAPRPEPAAHATGFAPAASRSANDAHAGSVMQSAIANRVSTSGVAAHGPALGGGTLLGGAALAQRRHAAAESLPPVPRSSRRPVPSGRDWRNPSRPPPPTAAIETDANLARVAHADTLTLPANDAPPRRSKGPALDAPRYLDGALELAVQSGASDLHLHAGAPLCMRIDGKLWPLTGDVAVARDVAERVIAEVLDETQWTQLMLDGELRFSYELAGLGRFRVHAYSQEHGTDMVFRLLPAQIEVPEKLGVGAVLRHLLEQPAGLCVCSGPPGAGKSTTLASLTQALATERARHVVSIESPIELVHVAGLGLIEQREVGKHVQSFARGIELALEQGADVIVISDLSAEGALGASLIAVRSRCLVLGGLRASSSAQALTKLLHASDADHAERLRFDLAHALRMVVHQRLVPRAKNQGRVAAIETLTNTPQVTQLLREDKLQQLPAVMSAGRAQGMLLLDDALEELVRAGTISNEAARRSAHRRERFKNGSGST